MLIFYKLHLDITEQAFWQHNYQILSTFEILANIDIDNIISLNIQIFYIIHPLCTVIHQIKMSQGQLIKANPPKGVSPFIIAKITTNEMYTAFMLSLFLPVVPIK